MTIKPENFIPPTKEDLEQERLADLTADERAAITEAEAEDAAELKASADGAAKNETEAANAEAAAAKVTADAKAKAETEAKAKADADAKIKAEANAKVAAEAAAKAKGEADGDGEGEDAPAAIAATEAEQPRSPRQAVPDWQAPEDAEAKLAAIATERDALGTKFDNGELTAKELLADQRKLDVREREIERALDRAQMASEMAVAVWEKTTVPAFLDGHTHYRDNETLYGMLDAEVRRLQVAASKANKDPLDPSILLEADKAIKASLAAFGVAPADESAAESAGETGAKPKPAKTAAAKPAIPPTLATIPASDITGTDSKYSGLDRLADANPLSFEEAYAKLPEAERDAYLAKN